ncbi:ABC transporter ATP-binding protein [Erysipelotrichaceae bacterium HCN-30851]
MLKIRSLTKKYKDKVVLLDMNLDIKNGSVFGLIGPNGSGKSTLLRIMAGISKPDVGCVCINEEKVYDNPDVKKDILLISDDPFYFFNASLKDMKEFYRLWYPNLDESIYEKYRSIFSLDENKPLKNFSKGMKRQSFIVLALAISPKYLFLDEAFDGLDPVMRLTFKRAISKLIEEKEMTVIISSHNLRELEDICDTYGILEDNKIYTSGYIDDAKENIHKIQLAFPNEKTREDFKELDVLSIHIQSRVVNLVVKGDIIKIKNYLQTMEPLMMEVLKVNLEEIFVYEMEKKGYGVYED